MRARYLVVREGVPSTPCSGNTAIHARAGKKTTLRSHSNPSISISTQAKNKEPQTGLGSKVYGPAEPRAVLYRIHAVIREGSQTANEPLPPPPPLVAQPRLLREDLRALCGARIARDVCADRACGLRERGEANVERGEEEREVWRCGGSGWRCERRQGRVCRRERVVRVCWLGLGGGWEERRGEEESFVRGRVAKVG